MRLDDAKYRAIRGWCLGCQIPMKVRRGLKVHDLDCEFTYRTPYLHSLTVTDYHWTSPIERNDPGREERYAPSGSLLSSHCSLAGCDYCNHNCSVGGFYCYVPEYIERMGNWEHVHVLGIVSLFGKIAIHERGYRADCVRIDHLWVLRTENVRFPHGKLQVFLEDTYQCGVTMLKTGAADSFIEWLKKEDITTIVEKGVTI